MTNPIDGIGKAQVMLVIGSNTLETHPIIGLRIRHAARGGAKLIVADPRRISLCDDASLWLRQRPGSDGALINALCHVILRESLEDKAFIAAHTEGVEALRQAVEPCTPEWAEPLTGVAAEDIRAAARLYATAERAAIFYTMGITQHSCGTDNVKALANLALLTGNFGKEGAGLNPLRGQNNVQGASDMGCSPVYYPGYQRVDDTAKLDRFQQVWHTASLSAAPGLKATEMPDAINAGTLKAMWIMGENPAISDPNASHVIDALKKLDFLVVQDIFLTETAELAQVVLPAASFAEKDGTFTNTERKVQRVRRALPPPGEAREDLAIINAVSLRMTGSGILTGGGNGSGRGGERFAQGMIEAADVFEEMAGCWGALAGMSHDRLDREGGLCWPCPAPEHPGTPVLHVGGFTRGKGLFTPVTWLGPKEKTDADYPLVLTTGRVLYHYHTGTMTRRAVVLEENAPRAYVEINPLDAARLKIEDGEMVRAVSRRGSIRLAARVTERVGSGLIFIPFHYKEAAANLLTNDALDPHCKIPEAKVCAVRVEKIDAVGEPQSHST